MAINVKIKSKNNKISLLKVVQGGKTLYVPLSLKDSATAVTFNQSLLLKTLIYDNPINDGDNIIEPMVGHIEVVDDTIPNRTAVSADEINPFNIDELSFDTIKNSSWWDTKKESHNVYEKILDLNQEQLSGYSYYPVNGEGTTFNDLIMVAKWVPTIEIGESGEYVNTGNNIGAIDNLTHSFCTGIATKYELVKNDIIDYNEPVTISRLEKIQDVMSALFTQKYTDISVPCVDKPNEYTTIKGYVIPIYAKYYFNDGVYTRLILSTARVSNIDKVIKDGYEISPNIRGGVFLGAYIHIGVKPEYEEYYSKDKHLPIPLNHLFFNTASIEHSCYNYIPYDTSLEDSNISLRRLKSNILILADNANEWRIEKCILIRLHESIYQNIKNEIYDGILIRGNTNTEDRQTYINITKNNDIVEIGSYEAEFMKQPDNCNMVSYASSVAAALNNGDATSRQLGREGYWAYIVGYAIENNSGYDYKFMSADELWNDALYDILYDTSNIPYKLLKECPYIDISLYNSNDYDIISANTYNKYIVNCINKINDSNELPTTIQGYVYNDNGITGDTPTRRIYWMSNKINITSDNIYHVTLLIPNSILNNFYIIDNALIYNIKLHHNINNTSDNQAITNIKAYQDFVKNVVLKTFRLTTPYYRTTKNDNTDEQTKKENLHIKNYSLQLMSLSLDNSALTYKINVHQLKSGNYETLITLNDGQQVRCMEFHLLIPDGKYSAAILRELNWCISFSVRYQNPFNDNYNDTTLKIPLNQLTAVDSNSISTYISELNGLFYFINHPNGHLDELKGETKGYDINNVNVIDMTDINYNMSEAYDYASFLTNLTKNGSLYTYSTSFSKLLYPEHADDKECQLVYFTIHLDYVVNNNNKIDVL